MAGTIPFSLSQQLDKYGKPLAGGTLYIYQAGTVSTPQIAYQDAALTIPVPGGNQLVCDAAGRLPQFFLADGVVKVRLSDKTGVTQTEADGVQVIGPSDGGGGGGGGAVDPTTIYQVGDVKSRYGTDVQAGYVRLNGRTIGSATSGATERANADCQALFQYLWNADPTLDVPGGRGVSALADWTTGHQIALPDFRSRALAGLSTMGSSDNGIYSGVAFTRGNSATLGAQTGATRRSLVAGNIPTLTGNTAPSTSRVWWATTSFFTPNTGVSFFPVTALSGSSGPQSDGLTIAATTATVNASVGSTGGGFDTNSPYVLITFYIKL